MIKRPIQSYNFYVKTESSYQIWVEFEISHGITKFPIHTQFDFFSHVFIYIF